MASKLQEIESLKAKMETLTEEAKEELREEFKLAVEKVQEINQKHFDLFGEWIDENTKPKRKGRVSNPTIPDPITMDEIQLFIDQKKAGCPQGEIKLPGRRAKTIQKLGDAYAIAKKKDAESVFELLEKIANQLPG